MPFGHALRLGARRRFDGRHRVLDRLKLSLSGGQLSRAYRRVRYAECPGGLDVSRRFVRCRADDPDVQPQSRGLTSRIAGGLQDALPALAYWAEVEGPRHVHGDPAVGDPAGALERCIRVAADPQGDALCRTWVEAGAV